MTTRPRTDTTVRRPGPLKRQAVKAKKLALQLVPRDDVLRERVRARGQNPNVTVKVKPSKPLSYLFAYLTERRYGGCIKEQLCSTLVTLHHGDELTWSRGMHDACTIGQLFAAVGRPEVFRLGYWFDPNVMVEGGGSNGDARSVEKPSDLFVVKSGAGPRTLYDGSNAGLSLLGSIPPFFGDSLGGVFGNGDSLHRIFQGDAPSLGALLGSPLKAGPLAAEFQKDADSSFDVDTKRSLFK